MTRFNLNVFRRYSHGRGAPSSLARTKTVLTRVLTLVTCVTGLSLVGIELVDADGVPASVGELGLQGRRAAEGWLRLEQDQRQARARAPDPSPRESARRQALEQQQRQQFSATLQDQRRELQALQREERLGAREPGTADARARLLLMQQDRTLRQQQLRRDVQTRVLRPGVGRIGPR